VFGVGGEVPALGSFRPRERPVDEVDAGGDEGRDVRGRATAASGGSVSLADTIASRNASPWPTKPVASAST